MDERSSGTLGMEHLPPPGVPGQAPGAPSGAGLDDPRVLQILSTEHWSLLSARALVYNEAFARAGMFLTFVSASFVALALGANAMAFSSDFLVLAAALLTLDLIIGLATVGRVLDTVIDDLRAIHGMNRIRNGYAQIAPQVLPFFVTSIHDDAAGVMATYGEPAGTQSAIGAFLHGLTTANGMINLINAVLAGAISGLLVVIFHGSSVTAAVAVVGVFTIAFVLESRHAVGRIRAFEASLESRFPTPPEGRPTD